MKRVINDSLDLDLDLDDYLDLTDDDLETDQTVDTRLLKRKEARQKFISVSKLQKLADSIPELPQPGEVYHVVSASQFDFWSFTPYIVAKIGTLDSFYGSTWTMNGKNVKELFQLYDEGKIRNIRILTGTYFNRREQAVYTQLTAGMLKRNQPFITFENHTKIILIQNKDHNIVIEGSANFTANPRLEQYVINNDRELLEFHRSWMDEILKKGKHDA